MHTIFTTTVKVLLLLMISSICFCQTEKFDIITYTPPKEWKKETKEGVVNYTAVNNTTGAFCVISMYASSASTGDAEKDFKREWKELVVKPYAAEVTPKTEKQRTPDGWESVGGASLVKVDGTDVYIILSVFSGFGKTVSIRTSINDQSYTAQIDALFESMNLDKTKTQIETHPNTGIAQTNLLMQKFGLMQYIAPEGWTHEQYPDGVVFKPIGIPEGEHVAIQILQPLNFSGTLEQALAQSFEEATTMYNGTSMYGSGGKYSKNASSKSFNGWEYIRGHGSIRLNDGTQHGTEYGLELFVIKINNRFERVAILESRIYCNGSSLYYSTQKRSYRNSIEQLLFSLVFADFNGPVLSPGSLEGGGIIGAWQGTMQSTSASAVRLQVFSPVFLSNEQVYFGTRFPMEGLNGINSRLPPQLNNRDWGTYTFSNGKGIVQMPYGNIPFRVNGKEIIFTKNQTDWPFYQLPSVDGATFNGTYVMSPVNGKIPSITFTSDGKFIDKGALKELYHENIVCLNPAITPGSGKYAVNDYSIVFNYSDGRVIVLAFLGAEYDIKDKQPANLRMSSNEDPMTRQ